MENKKIVIIDGYIDEPTCLGVPFYISTYVRYVAGAAKRAGFKTIGYQTIEQIRDNEYSVSSNIVVVISGNPVPGKYLGGMPIKSYEFSLLSQANPNSVFYIGGPIQYEVDNFKESNLRIIHRDIEKYIYNLFALNKDTEEFRSIKELNDFSVEGAFIVNQHPRYPDIIAEIETSRGCPRKSHCSFCVEGLYKVDFREPEAVTEEIRALNKEGINHFRLGKQADLYEFGSKLDDWVDGFPRPNVDSVKKLYQGIRESIPGIETLHLDNVNPGTIARFPDESYRITEIITEFNTPGDVAAMGLESADINVQNINRLKASSEQVKNAVKMINDIGGKRVNGIPKLLPGINIIKGLPGESRDTFRLNYEFLQELYNENILLRRINIRQIKITQNTYLNQLIKSDKKNDKKLDAVFRKYRKMIRDEIDHKMLEKVFPPGTVFNNVIIEKHRGDWSLARNIGTYPIVINIPKILPILSKVSVFVVGYRERSVVGLVNPFELKNASLSELKQIPGIKKRASEFKIKQNLSPADICESTIYNEIKSLLK